MSHYQSVIEKMIERFPKMAAKVTKVLFLCKPVPKFYLNAKEIRPCPDEKLPLPFK
jgi:hypothetical protein